MYSRTRKDKIRNDCIKEDIGVHELTENQLMWFLDMYKWRPLEGKEALMRRTDCMVFSPVKRERETKKDISSTYTTMEEQET